MRAARGAPVRLIVASLPRHAASITDVATPRYAAFSRLRCRLRFGFACHAVRQFATFGTRLLPTGYCRRRRYFSLDAAPLLAAISIAASASLATVIAICAMLIFTVVHSAAACLYVIASFGATLLARYFL